MAKARSDRSAARPLAVNRLSSRRISNSNMGERSMKRQFGRRLPRLEGNDYLANRADRPH
jgi:phage baseplate assembly protein W